MTHDERWSEWFDSLHRGGPYKRVEDVLEEVIWCSRMFDLGPNGNVYAGIDEGLVMTGDMMRAWVSDILRITGGGDAS